MKPTAARDIIRERTAYIGGRNCAHILLALVLLGAVVSVVVSCIMNLPSSMEREFAITVVASVALVNTLFTILLWYVAMAVFDTADCALANLQIESTL